MVRHQRLPGLARIDQELVPIILPVSKVRPIGSPTISTPFNTT
jgi:hypothetical protein